MKDEIIKKFGNRLRIRVSGILIQENRILMAQHHSLGEVGILWAPPGGGMNFGSCAEDNLIREFREETGIDIAVTGFLFVNEFLSPPLHAIELFFEVRQTGGTLITGKDPEMDEYGQVIRRIAFLNQAEIDSIGSNKMHGIFRELGNFGQILEKKGYFIS